MSQEKIPILLGWHINETNLKFQFTAFEGSFHVTVAIDELSCMKNAGAQIAMDFF